jgi:hypothetical protein
METSCGNPHENVEPAPEAEEYRPVINYLRAFRPRLMEEFDPLAASRRRTF